MEDTNEYNELNEEPMLEEEYVEVEYEEIPKKGFLGLKEDWVEPNYFN